MGGLAGLATNDLLLRCFVQRSTMAQQHILPWGLAR